MIHYTVSDGICLLRLDAPPVNALTLPLLEALRAAIERANAEPEVRGIVLAGDSSQFSAGADLALFQDVRSPEDAARASRVFQEVFRAVEDSARPVVAAVAGQVMGGALELAMACHGRVAAEGSGFRMPEVTLGINPGAGGTQRLPRLVGLKAALNMLLTGEPIDVPRALALGLVDAVCPGEQLIDRARSLLDASGAVRKTNELVDKLQDPQSDRAALDEAAASLAGVRPELIAPRKIVEAVRAGLEDGFDAGLRCEQEAFGECSASLAMRNKLYLFFATRQTAKVPELAGVEPAPIRKAAVVGAGTMGTGIVQALVAAGVPVVVRDENPAALDQAMEKIRGSLQRRVRQGKLAADQLEATIGLIHPTAAWDDLAGVPLVIEAVFEEVGVKRSVLGRLEGLCAAETILATNTSTISLEELAAGMLHPDRLIGMHFFNPAQRMPLVEIIRHQGTSLGTIATAMLLARKLGKTPVLVKSREGFLVNRIFIPYLKEAFFLLEEGAPARAIDQAMVDFGFPMGPLALIDMAGLDILVFADRVLRRAFPHHQGLSPIAERLVQRGHLGQKTASGVYRYLEGSHTPGESQSAGAIIAEVQGELGRTARQFGQDEITRRLVLRLVSEALDVLDEGIARCPADLDVASVLGIGFPDFRGGVLKYAEDLGRDTVLTQLESMTQSLGERYTPCQLLRQKGRGHAAGRRTQGL
jgi:3-hydroxyacyl-CoA dehydrogenase